MEYNEYVTKRKPFQIDGTLLLLEQKHACLFYKAGKGKTYPCVDAIREVDKLYNGNARVLILSTADAIKNMWDSEIVTQGILPKNTVTMSFNSAIVDKTALKLLSIPWNVLVIDESHKIKSHNSKTSKLVYKLSKNIEYVWGLSGTPRCNSDLDIFCQFHNMRIGSWGYISYSEFVDECCDIDRKFFNGQAIKVPTGINHRYLAGWERNLAKYTQRVDYDDSDEMPKQNVNLVELPFVPSNQYKETLEGVVRIGDYESTVAKLAAITKSHQAANGFLYIPNALGKNETHRFAHNEKIDWLKQNITKGMTIVYRFEADLELISDLLCEIGYSYTEIVNDFKSGTADILLLQCGRCESFNLQNCNRLVFFTMDYSYFKYDQMIHRIWRTGQTKDVQIDILIFKDSIESRIWETVDNKKTFADLFMSVKRGE